MAAMPPAPGRFSITNACFRLWLILSVSRRMRQIAGAAGPVRHENPDRPVRIIARPLGRCHPKPLRRQAPGSPPCSGANSRHAPEAGDEKSVPPSAILLLCRPTGGGFDAAARDPPYIGRLSLGSGRTANQYCARTHKFLL